MAKSPQKSIVPKTASSASTFIITSPREGVRIDRKNLFTSPTVYACTRVLSESIAGTPVDLYHRDGDTFCKAREHPAYKLIHSRPNDETTAYEMKQAWMIDMIKWGYAATVIFRDGEHGDGVPSEMVRIDPQNLKAVRDEKSGNLFYLVSAGKETFSFPNRDVMVLRFFADGDVMPPSLLTYQSGTIGAEIDLSDISKSYFNNLITPSGIMEAPEAIKLEDLQLIERKFRENYTGVKNAYKLATLPSGVKFTPFSPKNTDAQQIENEKYIRSVICGILRVPAHLINDLEKSTFSNVEHLDLAFVKHTLRPLARNIEERLNFHLLADEEAENYYFKFNFNDLVRGDLVSRYAAYSQGINGGILTPNEARGFEELPPQDGGDTLRTNGTLTPITSEEEK